MIKFPPLSKDSAFLSSYLFIEVTELQASAEPINTFISKSVNRELKSSPTI